MAKVDRQLLLYQFLQKHQGQNTTFTKEDLLEQVGWKQSTFSSYYGKGQITQFLAEIEPNTYEAINVLDVSFIEFKKRLSQSKHYQELGHKCKSNLAKALLKKSKDNMMLALELYNRPSLENKLHKCSLAKEEWIPYINLVLLLILNPDQFVIQRIGDLEHIGSA